MLASKGRMEQAPPPPPPNNNNSNNGTVSSMSVSSQIFMTPQLERRRDGLCPSLLVVVSNSNNNNNNNTSADQTTHCKSYRTNSNLLAQCKDETIMRDASELQLMQEHIHRTLQQQQQGTPPEQLIRRVHFTHSGCRWQCDLAIDCAYALTVIVFCHDRRGLLEYRIDTTLVEQPTARGGKGVVNIGGGGSGGTTTTTLLNEKLAGYNEAKAIFETVALQVRKAVVGLEFPEFPEGCKGRPFREVYQLNARLKSGSFATVCRGTHRATGRKVAIKCVLRKDLPPADGAAIYDEVAILASLNHPHIVPLIDFFDEKDCYFLVLELMSGGDLFDRIGKKKTYSEADARDLIVKMLKAVAYCHAHKIAHCDMKPKNLLLMSDDNDSYIKLADFGFAARVHDPKTLSKQCGTPFFVSPEILMRKPYDQAADMWSVGCIVFLLLSGNLPFMGRSQKDLFRKIVAGKYEFAEEDWQDVSEDAKDLVKKLLLLNPDERITAAEAVRHKWLKASKDRLSMIVLQGTSQRLKTFNARMKLRSAMIAVDWISSLKRMSWVSQRNLNGDGSPASYPATVATRSSSGGNQRNLMAATAGLKKMSLKDEK